MNEALDSFDFTPPSATIPEHRDAPDEARTDGVCSDSLFAIERLMATASNAKALRMDSDWRISEVRKDCVCLRKNASEEELLSGSAVLRKWIVMGKIKASAEAVFDIVREVHFLRRLWPAMETVKTLSVLSPKEQLIYLSSKHYIDK